MGIAKLAASVIGTSSTPDTNYVDDAFFINLRIGNGTKQKIDTPFSFGNQTAITRSVFGASYIVNSMAYGSGTLVAVGSGNQIYTSTDGGMNWVSRTSNVVSDLQRVAWIQAIGGFVAVGTGGKITTSPTGVTWTARTSGSTDTLYGITWNGTNVMVCTSTGKILTSPTGTTWTVTNPLSLTSTLYDIAADPTGLNLVTVKFGATYYSSNSGANWSTSGSTQFVMQLAYVNEDFWGFGTGNALSYFSGGTWVVLSPGVNIAAVGYEASTALYYVATRDGALTEMKVYSSTNLKDISTWQLVSTNANLYAVYGFLYGSEIFVFSNSADNGTYALTTKPASSEGGLVISKGRSGATDWAWCDTVRGATFDLTSTSTAAQTMQATGVTCFTPNGFEISTLAKLNTNAATYADYVFKKKSRFLDIVTWTGDGTSGRVISHALGLKPGVIILKRTDSTGNWLITMTYPGAPTDYPTFLFDASTGYSAYVNTVNTSSFTLGVASSTNISGATYVAHVFAHDEAVDGIIRSGEYIGNGSATGPVIDCGFEPQFILIKAHGAGSWVLLDSARELGFSSVEDSLIMQTTAAETATEYARLLSTGFQITSSAANVNTSGTVYTYMVIRRSNKPPTSGLEVFQPLLLTGTGVAKTVATNMHVDAILSRQTNSTTNGIFSWWDRLRGSLWKALCNSTAAPLSVAGSVTGFDVNTGYSVGTVAPNTASPFIHYCFKRAPGFFDQVCYVGDTSGGAGSQEVPHGLGITPELIITKSLTAIGGWAVSFLANGVYMLLNTTAATSDPGTGYVIAGSAYSVPDGMLKLGGGANAGANGVSYTSLLFATLDGISKVGSYTGNGGTQDIACGFSTGARFVLIKRTDAVGDWFVWDTARGIQAASDPHLSLNTTVAEVTADDTIDPLASGFTVNQVAATNVNVTSATYIFLAIA